MRAEGESERPRPSQAIFRWKSLSSLWKNSSSIPHHSHKTSSMWMADPSQRRSKKYWKERGQTWSVLGREQQLRPTKTLSTGVQRKWLCSLVPPCPSTRVVRTGKRDRCMTEQTVQHTHTTHSHTLQAAGVPRLICTEGRWMLRSNRKLKFLNKKDKILISQIRLF